MNFFSKLKGGDQKGDGNINTNNTTLTPDIFKKRLEQLADTTLDSLNEIWTEAGYQEDERQNLIQNLLNQLQNTCNIEVQSEQQILDHAKLEVTNKLQEFISLSSELGQSFADENSILKGYNTSADMLAHLEKLIKDISIEISQRQKLLDIEHDAIEALKNELGNNTPESSSLSKTSTAAIVLSLSDTRLHELRNTKTNLETLKLERIEKMKSVINECYQVMCDLTIVKEKNKQIVQLSHINEIHEYKNNNNNNNTNTTSSSSLWEFGVHIKTLTSLENELQLLIKEKETRRQELATTGAEIARLWTLLRISSAEREAFSKSFQMNLSLDTIQKGRDELSRLQTIRAESLSKVVSVIRADIALLWEELGVTSVKERQTEFPGYFIANHELEDQLVEEHDLYFQKIRTKIEKLRPLLAKITRRELVIQDRIDLEHIMLNPERLTARGPNAKEDRKREETMTNRVKNLEKLTTEILISVKAWEDVHGPFFYMGGRYVERVIEQEESYESTRNQLRSARRKKDGKIDTPVKTLPFVRKNSTIANASVLQGLASPTPSSGGGTCVSGSLFRLHHPFNTIGGGVNSNNGGNSGTAGVQLLAAYAPVSITASALANHLQHHPPTTAPAAHQQQPKHQHQHLNHMTKSLLANLEDNESEMKNDDDGGEDNDDDENDENYYHHQGHNHHHHNRLRSDSSGSDETEMTDMTEYTSATEVRDTASCCTVKKIIPTSIANIVGNMKTN